MNSYDNLNTLGWGMGAANDASYVDLPRKPSENEIQSIQQKCNEAIRNNISINVAIPEDVSSDKLPEDYDKGKGVIRVVRIGELDNNTCCGTRLSQISHVQLILLLFTQPVHSKECRLFFIAGERAITLATTSIHTLRSVGSSLSCGSSAAELTGSVNKMKDNVADYKRREVKLLAEIAKSEAERVKAVVCGGKNAWVHRATEGLDFFNMVISEVKDNVKDGVIIFASGEERKGGQIVIFGNKTSVEQVALKIKDFVTEIKGGGRGERWQGKVIEWKKGEMEALREFAES